MILYGDEDFDDFSGFPLGERKIVLETSDEYLLEVYRLPSGRGDFGFSIILPETDFAPERTVSMDGDTNDSRFCKTERLACEDLAFLFINGNSGMTADNFYRSVSRMKILVDNALPQLRRMGILQ